MKKTALRVAMHEAGHAVAMLAIEPPGSAIEYMTLLDLEPPIGGIVMRRPRWNAALVKRMSVGVAPLTQSNESAAQQCENAYLDIIEILAGPIAELRHQRMSWDDIDHTGFDVGGPILSDSYSVDELNADDRQVRERLEWLCPADPPRYFHDRWCETIELVKREWQSIDALGRLLSESGRLEAYEIYGWWNERRAPKRLKPYEAAPGRL